MRNCIITALLEKVKYDKVVQKSLNICKNYTDLEFWPQSSNTHTIIQFVLLKKVCSFGNSFSQMYCKYYMVDFSTVQNARSSREELQTFSPQGRISVRLLFNAGQKKKFFFTDFKKPILLENFFTKITFQVHQQVLFELLFMRNFTLYSKEFLCSLQLS